ncbi:MAG: PASTA domain-containing protein [Eggerthellaceae bacterium]|nr:PASTA domain-containing protein [Eggerthellaceae bacterium]
MVSLTSEDAQTAIGKAGLAVGKVERKHSNEIAIGHVISQDPVPATMVEKGTAVSLVVSDGKDTPDDKTVTVPDVTGKTLEAAEDAIEKSRLSVGRIEEKYSGKVDAGRVVSQDPSPSTKVEKGTSVKLVVSKGEEPVQTVTVPDVTGMTQDGAEAEIEKKGLSVGKVQEKHSSEVDAGCVISQDPTAGTKVDKGASVKLVVSTGEEPAKTVSVPDVSGMTQEGAEKSILTSGLAVGGVDFKYSGEIPEGRVISQDPTAGTKVDKGASVKLVVSKGEEPAQTVSVPDVTGMTKESAESTLQDASLKGVCDGEVESKSVDPGCVVRQSIDPGTEVAEGTEVDFEVAVPPSMVSVPAIRGKSSDKAASIVENVGLVYDASEDYSDDVEKGYVISQDPAPEEEVPYGSTVSAVVSLGPEPKQQVEVPDLTGLPWSDAKDTLESVGLGAEKTGDPDGNVTGQDIDPGTMVDEGTVVTVTLASPAQQVKVPKVVGLTWKKAKKVLEEADLVADDTGDDDGLVVSQDPKDGSSVDEGSTVEVELDKDGKAKVPDLVGLSVDAARQALDDVGLKTDSDMPNHGTVSSQEPEAGEKAEWGSVVTLEVDTSDFE